MEGGLPPSYVLDEMELYEVPHLIKAIELKRRPAWEQARMIALVSANAFGAKLKQKNIPLPWDDEQEVNVSPTDIRNAKKRLHELKKQQNNK